MSMQLPHALSVTLRSRLLDALTATTLLSDDMSGEVPIQSLMLPLFMAKNITVPRPPLPE